MVLGHVGREHLGGQLGQIAGAGDFGYRGIVDGVEVGQQKITRAVIETIREPTFDMVFAEVERLRTSGGAAIAGPVLEEAWAAMVDVVLAELPEV